MNCCNPVLDWVDPPLFDTAYSTGIDHNHNATVDVSYNPPSRHMSVNSRMTLLLTCRT